MDEYYARKLEHKANDTVSHGAEDDYPRIMFLNSVTETYFV